MVEIRIHGRGGQGSVTMAELLAEAAFYSGKVSQAFPSFGVERRGAPVTAFVRIDDKFIRLRSQVYSPDYAIVQDVTLLEGGKIMSDLKNTAVILMNSCKEYVCAVPRGVRIRDLDATGIAREVIGKPIINTVLLGSFAAMSGLIKLDAVEKAIRQRFQGEVAELNVQAAKRGYETISNN